MICHPLMMRRDRRNDAPLADAILQVLAARPRPDVPRVHARRVVARVAGVQVFRHRRAVMQLPRDAWRADGAPTKTEVTSPELVFAALPGPALIGPPDAGLRPESVRQTSLAPCVRRQFVGAMPSHAIDVHCADATEPGPLAAFYFAGLHFFAWSEVEHGSGSSISRSNCARVM